MRNINGKRQAGSSRELLPQGGEDLRRYTQNKRADSPKVSIREALLILREMASGTGTIDALERATQVSRATLYRLLADCEGELGIRFKYHGGTYTVKDWGLLSRRRVLEEGDLSVAHPSHRKGTYT